MDVRILFRGTGFFMPGLQYKINSRMYFGVEASYRYTNTDYIDDVGSTFYDTEAIRAKYGDIAAALSFRAPEKPDYTGRQTIVGEGGPRGGKWVDTYQFLVFSISYKLTTNRNGLPKLKKSY